MGKKRVYLKGRNFTEDEFNKIKTLTKTDLSDKQIQGYVGWSTGTIGYVKRANDYAGYRALTEAAYNRKVNKDKDASSVSNGTVQTGASTEINRAIETEKYLVAILNSLKLLHERLDRLEQGQTKRRFF